MSVTLTDTVSEDRTILETIGHEPKKCNKCNRTISPNEYYFKYINTNPTLIIKYSCFSHFIDKQTEILQRLDNIEQKINFINAEIYSIKHT